MKASVSPIERTYTPRPRNGCTGNQADGITGSLGPEWGLGAVECFLYAMNGTEVADSMLEGTENISLATQVEDQGPHDIPGNPHPYPNKRGFAQDSRNHWEEREKRKQSQVSQQLGGRKIKNEITLLKSHFFLYPCVCGLGVIVTTL